MRRKPLPTEEFYTRLMLLGCDNGYRHCDVGWNNVTGIMGSAVCLVTGEPLTHQQVEKRSMSYWFGENSYDV